MSDPRQPTPAALEKARELYREIGKIRERQPYPPAEDGIQLLALALDDFAAQANHRAEFFETVARNLGWDEAHNAR